MAGHNTAPIACEPDPAFPVTGSQVRSPMLGSLPPATTHSCMFKELERFGDRTAVIDEAGNAISYRELARLADDSAARLPRAGAARQLIAIECANTLEVLLAYLGALRAGHVVILTGAAGAGRDSNLVRTFRPNWVLHTVPGGESWFERVDEQQPELAPELAILLSTSGTTGSSKLVRLSHENLAANARSIGEYLELGPQDRTLTCLPMHYSYGLSVIHSHLLVGASLVLTSLSISTPEFWELFDARSATNFQGVPHSFELLLHSGFMTRRHPSLRFFTQAGGRLDATQVEAFTRHAAASGCKFYVMYGQTEATARMAWLPPQDALAHADAIGQPIPGGRFWIERDGQPVADGEEGELVYAGPNVMLGYATSRAELALGRTIDVLHTGDLAVRRPSGYYCIVGRARRFLKVFGLRINLDDVEHRLRELGCVAGATGTDEQLVIAVEGERARDKASAYVQSGLGLPGSACRILAMQTLPRLYNGKIDYPAINTLAGQRPARSPDCLIQLARATFRDETIDGSKSFVELGGDSLSYVSFALAAEKQLGSLPAGWERIPLHELQGPGRRHDQPSSIRTIPIDIALRAGAILMVLVNHFFTLHLDGSALLLMVIAGYNFSRFQAPRLASGEAPAVVRSLVLTVLVPYLVTLIPAAVLIGPANLPNLLLMYNFVDDATQEALPAPLVFFWYIESYLWIMAGVTLLLCVPRLGRLSVSQPLLLPGALFILLETLRALFETSTEGGIFRFTSPLMVGSAFMMGWMLYAAGGLRQRSLLLALLAIVTVVLPHEEFPYSRWILIPGLLLLALLPSFRLRGFTARYLAPLIALVAASSLYIYMEQFYVFWAMIEFIEPSYLVKFVGVIVSVLFGVVVQQSIGWVTRLRPEPRASEGGRWVGNSRSRDAGRLARLRLEHHGTHPPLPGGAVAGTKKRKPG